MMIEMSTDTVERLQKLLETLDNVLSLHEDAGVFYDLDEIIEPWTPSDQETLDDPVQISCPEFTVGTLKEARILKENLKL
jgi:hypothetical protein